jgi:hypothetical protein
VFSHRSLFCSTARRRFRLYCPPLPFSDYVCSAPIRRGNIEKKMTTRRLPAISISFGPQIFIGERKHPTTNGRDNQNWFYIALPRQLFALRQITCRQSHATVHRVFETRTVSTLSGSNGILAPCRARCSTVKGAKAVPTSTASTSSRHRGCSSLHPRFLTEWSSGLGNAAGPR